MKRLIWCAMVGLLATNLAVCAQKKEESISERAEKAGGVTEHGESELIWGSINFVILAAGLGYLIKKNAGPYFAKRSLEIRKGLVEAEAARAESDAKVAEVDRRLANLQAEIDALREGAKQEAEVDAERVRRATAAELARIRTHMAEEIAAAAKSARLELRRYSAELALSLAEQKIAAGMSPETEARLVDGFVAGVSSP